MPVCVVLCWFETNNGTLAHILYHFWHEFGDVPRMNESFSRSRHVLNKWQPSAKTAKAFILYREPIPSPPTEKRHLRHCLECHFPLKIIPQIVMCAHQQVQAFCGNAPNFSGKLKTKTSLQIYPKWFWAFQQNIRSLILRHVTQTKRNGIYNTPYTLYLRRIFSHTVGFTSQIFALFNHAFRWKKFDLLYCREIVNLY